MNKLWGHGYQTNRQTDSPPTAFLDAEHTGERQVAFNIGEELSYTKDGQ